MCPLACSILASTAFVAIPRHRSGLFQSNFIANLDAQFIINPVLCPDGILARRKVQIDGLIALLEEDRLAPVPALSDVVSATWNNDPRKPCHASQISSNTYPVPRLSSLGSKKPAISCPRGEEGVQSLALYHVPPISQVTRPFVSMLFSGLFRTYPYKFQL